MTTRKQQSEEQQEQQSERPLEDVKQELIDRLAASVPLAPHVPINVQVNEDYLSPRMRSDDAFSSVDEGDSWKEYADDMSERLARWPHLPRRGDLICDEVDSARVINVLHNVTPGEEHITVFVGESEEPFSEASAPGQRKPRELEVTFDEELTREAALTDEFHQPEYEGAEAFLKHLATRLAERPSLPRIGENIMDGREVFTVVDIDHYVSRPTNPEADPYNASNGTTIWLGSGPIEEAPAPTPMDERRIPERIQTYQGEKDTIFVIENMRNELETLHAMAQSVWKTLKEADELRDWECVSLADFMVGELEHKRSQVDAIIEGYYGREGA